MNRNMEKEKEKMIRKFHYENSRCKSKENIMKELFNEDEQKKTIEIHQMLQSQRLLIILKRIKKNKKKRKIMEILSLLI